MNSEHWSTEIAELRAALEATRPSTGQARRVVLKQARDPRARALREAYHRRLAAGPAAREPAIDTPAA